MSRKREGPICIDPGAVPGVISSYATLVASIQAEVTLRGGRVWSNVSAAETVALLERAKMRLLGNMPEPEPVERGKEELQT